jgi:hypothetical protein
MYSAISAENRPVLATYIKVKTDREVPADMRGGIIVFPKAADVMLSDLERIVPRHEPLCWTVGKFFSGRYTDKNGQVYSEDSLSVEIIGISDDELTETTEELCRTFSLDSVLIKSYTERYQIYIVE